MHCLSTLETCKFIFNCPQKKLVGLFAGVLNYYAILQKENYFLRNYDLTDDCESKGHKYVHDTEYYPMET